MKLTITIQTPNDDAVHAWRIQAALADTIARLARDTSVPMNFDSVYPECDFRQIPPSITHVSVTVD